jgi:hypothetical protein
MDSSIEARTGLLLQLESERWFCSECLAVLIDVSPQTMQETLAILERSPGYRVSDRQCSVCERVTRVIRAVADSGTELPG